MGTLTAQSDTMSPMRAEKIARREALRAVRDRNPYSKGGTKAGALLLDLDRFDDWVAEYSVDVDGAGLLHMIAAQVASGVTLRGLCEHYAVEYGLLWAWLTDTEFPERLERYYLAQRGVADAYVAEVVPLVDDIDPDDHVGGGRGGGGGSSSPDVPHKRLQAEMRLKVAGRYDRARFGEDRVALGTGSVPVINFVMGAGSVVALESAAGPAAPGPRIIEAEILEGAVVENARADAEFDNAI